MLQETYAKEAMLELAPKEDATPKKMEDNPNEHPTSE